MEGTIKKHTLLLVTVLIMALLLSGCGQKKSEQANPATDGTKKLKVGLVYDLGGRGDKSFNDAAYSGLEKAQRDFADKIEVKYLEPTGSGENREQLLRLLSQEKYDLVLGIGLFFTDSIPRVARDFPQTKYGLVDGYVPGLKPESNVICLLFREHEGAFLVGAAAALKSKTGKIGFVGGMQSPLIEKIEAGYTAGARYINPQIQVVADYVGTTGEAFKDPVKGKELALKQIQGGVDVLFQAAGASGVGVFEAATAPKIWMIGCDADQSLNASDIQRPLILTSMQKRVDNAVYQTIKALIDKEFKGGYQEFGLKEGGVGYAENEFNRDLIGADKVKLDDIKEKIISGEIKVPASKKDLK
ncbi:MAG TPA: BMP family ABC transporter substrate-binding protein [Patescibacteria group bacterium]|nr:BMP family ABC transporter substrate-binding protein [Patescibacteria group bacterium]